MRNVDCQYAGPSRPSDAFWCIGTASRFGAFAFVAASPFVAPRNSDAAIFSSRAAWHAAVGDEVTTIDFSEPPPEIYDVREWYQDEMGVTMNSYYTENPANPLPIYRIVWEEFISGYVDPWVLAPGLCPTVQCFFTFELTFQTPIIGFATTLSSQVFVHAFDKDMTEVAPRYNAGGVYIPVWGVTYDSPVTTLRFRRPFDGGFYFGDMHWAHVPSPGALPAMALLGLRPARRQRR
jgi:hypothetical protein